MSEIAPAPPPSVRRILRLTQGTLGRFVMILVFLTSLLFGAVAHLNLPVSKRAAAGLLMDSLSDSIRGTIRVGGFTRLERTGIELEDVEILDPWHRPTLKVKSLSAEVDVLTILERVLSNNEKLSVEIRQVRAQGCEVHLHPTADRDESGTVLTHASIRDAFEPIKKATRKKKRGRPVRVWFPSVQLKRVYARGSIAGSPTVEARVPGARAKILITNKGASIDIERFRMRASGVAGVDTTANGEIHIRAPGPVWGDVRGTIGEVPLTQKFRFEKGTIDVEGELPSLRPESLRPLFGAWPLDRTVAVKNHLSGKPPLLDVELEVTPEGDSEASPPVAVTGNLRIAPTFEASLNVVTNQLNLDELLSSLPPSTLNSESKVRLKSGASGPEIEVESKIAEGIIAGETTPEAEFIAKLKDDTLTIDGSLNEPGLAARFHLARPPKEPLRFTVDVSELLLHDNEHLRKLSPATRGLIQGSVKGTLEGSHLRTEVELSVGGFRQGDISFNHGTLTGTTETDLNDAKTTAGSLTISLIKAHLGAAKLESGTVTANGQLLSPQVDLRAKTETGLQLKASAFVGIEEKELREFNASITGKGKPVEASASRLSLRNSRVAVTELLLKSIGEIRGDIDFGGGGGKIQLQAEGLSISRIAQSLGLPRSEYGGELNADIDLHVAEESQGTVDLTVTNGALYGIDNVSLEAHATIDGDASRGNINGRIADLGTLESSWETTLAGPLLDPDSSRQATGKLRAQVRNFDLHGFTLLLGKALGLPPLRGSVDAVIDLERDSPEEFPEGEVQFSTNELSIKTGIPEDELIIRGLDLNGALSFRPQENQLEGVVRLNDHKAILASISGALELPLDQWSTGLPQEAEFVSAVRSAPLDAVVVVPRRNLRRWPAYIPVPFDAGSIGVRASATGSLAEPSVGVVVDARHLEGGVSPFASPIGLDVNAQYLSSSGALRSSVSIEHNKQRLGVAQANVTLPFAHFSSRPPPGTPWWTGSAQIQFDNAPLQLLDELKRRNMRGTVQGVVAIERPGWRPEISSEVRLRGLAFGGHRLGDAILEAQSHSDDLVARAQFNDEHGSLQVTAEAGVVPTATLLKVANRRSILMTLESDRYDAAVMLPFVADIFDELNGSLSGRLKAEWNPPTSQNDEWTTELSGTMKMTEGVLTPSALGLRLEETRFNLTAAPEGEYNVVRLKNIAARAESDHHNLKGDANLFFKNLELQGGMFYLSPTKVPLKSQGEALAIVTGTAQGRFDLNHDEIRVEVGINNLLAELPSSSESDLFHLEENPDIEILQYATPEEEVQLESAVPIDVRFRLGNNVRLKSEVLDLKVRGEPNMRLSEDFQLGGSVELIPGGRFVVLGRGFNVEEGTVLFDTGDPTNPHLAVTASWKAPNDVLVRATVRGTANEPKLEWSSTPALPGGEAEIIALVLGGGGGSTDQGAAGFSSGIAYAANEAIGTTGVQGLEFYTTQESGTSDGRMASLNDTTWENYTASFQINDKLWFEGSVQSGTGTGPSAETRRGVSGTLDWRFHPQWSARTEIGTLGTGLDLVWKYRY